MSFVPPLEYMNFPKHYESVLVESKEIKDVFNIKVSGSGGFVAFIERIAFDWTEGSDPEHVPSTAAVLELVIDGVKRKYEYEIPINNPYIFNPPYVARRNIILRVTNNDVPYQASDGTQKTGAHWFGVMIDGTFARPKV